MLGIWFVPESPRWTYMHKGREAAEAVLTRLRQTDSEHVAHELGVIGRQVEQELREAKGLKELTEPSIRKRVLIAMGPQVLQQATGITPIMSYGALIFKDITHAGIYSSLFITGVKSLATIPAMRWVDTCGRRYLLLIGAAGMIGGHLMAAILFTALCDGNVSDAGCPKVGGWIICIGTALFSIFYGISWGPVCWIYPAEIFPMSVRASAVSLTTASNWVMAALMTQVVKLFPYLNINGVFFLFADFCCICFLFVYFFCPETMGVMLEDVELLFDGPWKSAKSGYGEMKSPVNAA